MLTLFSMSFVDLGLLCDFGAKFRYQARAVLFGRGVLLSSPFLSWLSRKVWTGDRGGKTRFAFWCRVSVSDSL